VRCRNNEQNRINNRHAAKISRHVTHTAATSKHAVLGPGETPPERARHTIQDRKIMVTIAWNPLGYPLIGGLPKGRTFNAEYYRDNILAALTQFQPEDDGRKLVVHVDNVRAHTDQKSRTFCEENVLRLAPHPPYSPDLAPSDFFLFSYVKERLKGMVFPSYEEFFPSRCDHDHVCLLDRSSWYLEHLPFPDMRDFNEGIADKIRQWAEISPCPHCGAVLLRGMSHELCCKPFAGRIKNHLPPPMGRELFDHIVELTQSTPNFPWILNRDLQAVLQHARVSSPNAGASNVFIPGIPDALDSYREFIIPVYTIFFRTQQRIPIFPGGPKEIIASILSQNKILRGYLRDG
jgi:transposase